MTLGYILYIRLMIISLFMAKVSTFITNINECLPNAFFYFVHACMFSIPIKELIVCTFECILVVY